LIVFLYAAAAVLDVVFFTLLGARFLREIRAGRAGPDGQRAERKKGRKGSYSGGGKPDNRGSSLRKRNQ